MVKGSKASGASEAWQVSQPVQGLQAGAGGPVQVDRTVQKQVKNNLRFSNLVLWYITLVSHTQSQVDYFKLVIQGTLSDILNWSYDIAS